MANKESPLPFLRLLVSIYGLGPLVSFWKETNAAGTQLEEEMQKTLSATQVKTKMWTWKEDVLLQPQGSTKL
jgi:hypothetical protein